MNRFFYRLLRLNYFFRYWFARQFTPSGLGLLCCLLFFGLIGLDIKRSVSYQVFAFLLALLGIAIASSRFNRYRFSASRRLPRFGTVGVPLTYRVLLHNNTQKNRKGLSLTEVFSDAFPSFQDFSRIAKGGTRSKTSRSQQRRAWLRLMSQSQQVFSSVIALPELRASQETEIASEVVPLRRGLLQFKKLTIACPDPLGFVNRCVTLSLPQAVLILPKRYQIPEIELPGGRRHQSGGLALAASVGDSEEFRALREYRPGDSPRKIHWKSWAKTGKPIVKEEQAEYSVRHALILDTFQAEAYSEVMEEAVAIAASLAYSLQSTGQTQESLLDLVFTGTEAHPFTAGRSLGNTERLLALLASVVPCQDKAFDSLLPVVQERLSMLSGCICIFLDWDGDRKKLVEQLQSARIPTLVLVVSGEKGLSEPVDMSCLSDRQSSLHVVHVGSIQEDLWTL